MDRLIDTNVLLRIVQREHAMHPAAWESLRALRRRRDRLCLIPQIVVELWSASTRPIGPNNGLGLTAKQALRYVSALESLLVLFPDTPDIYREWRRMVEAHAIIGKQAHDARVVAAMNVHGIHSIVTFNTEHFRRYTQVEAVNPGDVA